jgi:hypothetical protein
MLMYLVTKDVELPFLVLSSKSIGGEFGNSLEQERNEPGNGMGRRRVHCGTVSAYSLFSARIRRIGGTLYTANDEDNSLRLS